ncbi:polysaccharide deacetylase family protein [Clostridium baratii]|uniref:polysaccharide deacetylase family protein n=1 Tax=Clostridium baratii TaxID=1561 RepID=UPI00242DEC25|nr:polysaccharide deacetylase family protein [Clostridium baratii]
MKNKKGKVHNYNMNVRRNFERQQKARRKKVVALVGLVIVLIIGGFGIYSAVSSNGENKEATASQSSSSQQPGQAENNNNSVNTEASKLDNSGYIPLKDDKNADDAKVVAERTSGLLKGKLHYPVRDDGKKVVYLTFDDGPSTTNTPEVLDILKKYDVKATFFVMGKSLADHPGAKELLKREASEGHAIANHSYSHDYKYLYPNRVININNFMEEYNKTNALMKEMLGKDFSTRTVRFPGGYWSWNGRENARPVLDKNGIEIVDWDALNGDAEGSGKSTPEQLVAKTKKTVEALGPNADSVVFLMHDTYGKENTVKALPEIIEYFKSKGFEFRTMK